MTQLNYESNNFIERLANAHNPGICPIRANYIGLLHEYLRNNVWGNVVVCGSGFGLEAAEIAKNNSLVLGIENNPLLLSLSRAYIQAPNIQFALGDFTELPISDRKFGHAVLDFGTIGNFSKPEQKRIIRELTRVAENAHIDFYTSENNQNRLEMYAEEGWKNVHVKDNAIVTDDGGYSQIFDGKEEFSELIKSALKSPNIQYHEMPGFGYMAKIE